MGRGERWVKTLEREREKNKEASTVEWIRKKVHASAESAERTPE
jgi:hypothetical protein